MKKLSIILLPLLLAVGQTAAAEQPRTKSTQMSPAAKAEAMAGAQLRNMDSDRDGNISKDEFLSAPLDAWTRLDQDGNGKATKDELKAFHQAQLAQRADLEDRIRKLQAERRGAQQPANKKPKGR